MVVLNAVNISKLYGTNVILDSVSFEISHNDKIGLVGVNGAGKTTLFKILTSQLDYDGAEIYRAKDLKIGYMEQYSFANEKNTLINELEECFSHVREIEDRLNNINSKLLEKTNQTKENLLLQARLNDEFIDNEGLYYKNRILATLRGLGFSELEFERSVDTLSGGQRSKLSLAKLLMSGSNLLLLDEPTNHLDIESIEWLETFLKDFKGAYIVISHDRYFLDNVTQRTFEIENSRLNIQNGNYSAYLEKKTGIDEAINKKYNDTLKEIKRIEAIVKQQRQWNRERNIKTAESKLKQIERLKQNLVIPKQKAQTLDFCFKPDKTSGNDIVEMKDVSLSFDGKPVLKSVNFDIAKGERVFLYGANGSGKSSIFKLIMNIYNKENGSIRIGENVKIGYYDQKAQTLDFNKTIFDEVYDTYPKLTQTEIRNALAMFLFKGEDVFLKISDLSGGERSKVALLKIMLSGANFLLLDEPTNHLDISSKEVLENALINYEGTIFIISHDRYFINKLSDRIIYLKDGLTSQYQGNYDDFIEKIKQLSDLNIVTDNNSQQEGAKTYKEKKIKESYARSLLSRIKKSEQEIEDIESQIRETQRFLDTEEIYTDHIKTAELFSMLTHLKEIQQKSLEKWETLLEEYEKLE